MKTLRIFRAGAMALALVYVAAPAAAEDPPSATAPPGNPSTALVPTGRDPGRAQAIANSGMVPDQAEAISGVAQSRGEVILMQATNKSATGNIAGGAATKGLGVKAKSASSGPADGWIPMDQSLSPKVTNPSAADLAQYGSPQGVLDHYNAEVQKAIANGYEAVTVTDPATGNPVTVLGKNGVPITADYDLLAVGRPFPSLGAVQNDPNMGNVTPQDVDLIGDLNIGTLRPTRWVVQHGPANQAPVDPGINYPVTAFDENGNILSIPKGPDNDPNLNLRNYVEELASRGIRADLRPEWTGSGGVGRAANNGTDGDNQGGGGSGAANNGTDGGDNSSNGTTDQANAGDTSQGTNNGTTNQGNANDPNAGQVGVQPAPAAGAPQQSLPQQLGATTTTPATIGEAATRAGFGAASGAVLGIAVNLASCLATVAMTGDGSKEACWAQATSGKNFSAAAVWGAVAALGPWGELAAAVYGGYQGAYAYGTLIGEVLNTGSALAKEELLRQTSEVFQPVDDAIRACNFATALGIAQQLQQTTPFVKAGPYFVVKLNYTSLINRLEAEDIAQRTVNGLVALANLPTTDPAQQQVLLNKALTAAGDITCLQKLVPPFSPPKTASTPPPKPASSPPPKQAAAGGALATSVGTNVICGYGTPMGITDGYGSLVPNPNQFSQTFAVSGTCCPAVWCLNNDQSLPVYTNPGTDPRTASLPGGQCKQNQQKSTLGYAGYPNNTSFPSLTSATCPGAAPTTAAATPRPSAAPSSPTSALSSPYEQPLTAVAAPNAGMPAIGSTQPASSTAGPPAPCATPKASTASVTTPAAPPPSAAVSAPAPLASTPIPLIAQPAIRLRSTAPNSGTSSTAGPPAPCATPKASITLRQPNFASPNLPATNNAASSPVHQPCSTPSQPNAKAASLPQSGQPSNISRSQTSTPRSQTTTSRSSSSGRSVGGQAQNSSRFSRGSSGFASNGAGHSGFGGGGFGHGGFGGGGGGGGGGGHRSDIRLKEDIVPLGRLDNGIGLYRFRYRGDDHTAYVGVMAQEVQALVPEAVSRGRDGYLRVDYDRLGLEFLTWDEWVARGSTQSRTMP